MRPAFFFLLTAVLLFPAYAQAQSGAAGSSSNSIWESGRTTMGKVKGAANKKATSFRSWKEHLKTWGLDSTYRHSLSIGGRLNSDGWSGSVCYGNIKAGRKRSLWQLSFSEVKGEKETKQQRENTTFPQLGNSSPYIFGKINNLYLLQAGYGLETVLLPAVLEGNVSIGFRWNAGLSLAMLKPYYLKLIYPDYSTTPASATLQEERLTENNREQFLNPSFILGRGKWSNGLDEIRYVPGIYAEAAISIVPRKSKTFVQVITLGASGSVYTESLPVMADVTSYSWLGQLFARLEIAKRWK